MATQKVSCKYQKSNYRNSFKWLKQQKNRFLRRQTKQDPENSWRKMHYLGYYS